MKSISRPSQRELLLTFFLIGAIGFGGGMAMLALIREHLVKKRGWISDDDLSVAVAMGQILPGPFVSNYVEYIGYKLFRLKGMILSAIFFLLPSYSITLLASYVYFQYTHLPLLREIFSFIAPAIPAILLYCAIGMARDYFRSLSSLIFPALAFFGLYYRLELILVIVVLGLLPILIGKFQRVIKSTHSLLFSFGGLLTILVLGYIFLKIGALIFGGGFVAIPFIEREFVGSRGWLTQEEFIAGVAISQITPGPVAILATFVGYKVGGILGSLVATISIFLPSFLMLLGLIKIYERVKENFYVRSFLSGVKPGIVGLILFAAFSLGRGCIIDLRSAAIAIASFSLLFLMEPVFIIIGLGILGAFHSQW